MSHALALSSSGPRVRKLIDGLNRVSPTRLPLLSGEDFSAATMARVMEFQFHEKLGVDGVAGSSTLARLQHLVFRSHQSARPGGRAIVINLIPEVQSLTAFEAGEAVPGLTRLPCHGGSMEFPSSRGVFQMTSRRLLHHTSDVYPEPPDNMACSLFYTPAEAIHQGPVGKPSHGCIHVDIGWASKLFHWAGSSDILVIVLGKHAKIGRGHTYPPEIERQIDSLRRDLDRTPTPGTPTPQWIRPSLP
jgi:hypothetical protein